MDEASWLRLRTSGELNESTQQSLVFAIPAMCDSLLLKLGAFSQTGPTGMLLCSSRAIFPQGEFAEVKQRHAGIGVSMSALPPIEARGKAFDILRRLIATRPRQRSPRDA